MIWQIVLKRSMKKNKNKDRIFVNKCKYCILKELILLSYLILECSTFSLNLENQIY